MSTNFLSLPRELRNNIYEQVLVLEQCIACPTGAWFEAPRLEALTPGLLRANKAVYLEASSILYAKNCFDFTMCDSEDVLSFFEKIGRNNASHILNILMDFPKFQYQESQGVTLEEDSADILARIQSDCTKLDKLTTSLYSTDAMENFLDRNGYPNIIVEGLALVNTSFRAIVSLQQIIVDVHEDDSKDHIRGEMKNHGWKISEKKYVNDVFWWD